MNLFSYLDQTKENIEATKTNELSTEMARAIELAVNVIRSKKMIAVAGNGGSMADAQHLSGELVNYFTRSHNAFPVLTLGVNSSVSSAWANDFEFAAQLEREFSAYTEFCGMVIVFTTSGKSENINRLLEKASQEGIPSVAFASEIAISNFKILPNILLCPKVRNTSRIQEIHVNLMHYFCQEIENQVTEL